MQNNKFIETADVFGFKYGTLKETVNNFFFRKKIFPEQIYFKSNRYIHNQIYSQ